MLMTSPKVVISPVMARLAATGRLIALETSAVKREVPADGPSLGVAPIGT